MSAVTRRLSAPARRRAESAARAPRRPMLAVTSALAALALVAGSITAGFLFAPAAQAGTGPTVTLVPSGEKGVLAGENETLSLTIANDSADAWFNVGVSVRVPKGLSFVDADGLGKPTIYTGGSTLPNGSTLPTGVDLWVWQDTSDLPAGSTREFELTVKPTQPAIGTGVDSTATVFPVGAEFRVEANAYASTEPRYLPTFPGSKGKGSGNTATTVTGGMVVDPPIKVTALRVTKSEPSPEAELMRGVHDNSTQYTLTVKNTDQGTTRAGVSRLWSRRQHREQPRRV